MAGHVGHAEAAHPPATPLCIDEASLPPRRPRRKSCVRRPPLRSTLNAQRHQNAQAATTGRAVAMNIACRNAQALTNGRTVAAAAAATAASRRLLADAAAFASILQGCPLDRRLPLPAWTSCRPFDWQGCLRLGCLRIYSLHGWLPSLCPATAFMGLMAAPLVRAVAFTIMALTAALLTGAAVLALPCPCLRGSHGCLLGTRGRLHHHGLDGCPLDRRGCPRSALPLPS